VTTPTVGLADVPSPFCPVFQQTMELVGRRWSGAIIRSLMAGRVRFSDVLGDIPGLSDRLLSERLRELEGRGLVARSVYAETPVRIEYQLTQKGRDLHDVVRAIDAWGAKWAGT
jgi:DNA-binding HxlR family transcriptional regulator